MIVEHKDAALAAIKNGHAGVLITGNIYDLCLEEGVDSLYYRPNYLAEQLHQDGSIVIRYSRGEALSVYRQKEVKNTAALNKVIDEGGFSKYLKSRLVSEAETVDVFRGMKRVSKSDYGSSVVFIIDYASHLAGSSNSDREMQIVIEAINDISFLPSVVHSRNSIVLYGHDETTLSPLLKGLYKVNYQYPSLATYEQFFSILDKREDEYAKSRLSPKELAPLARGLNLIQLTNLSREVKAKGELVNEGHLIEEKKYLINRLSEGTLTVLSTDINFDHMAGLVVAKKVLKYFASKLKQQDPSSVSRVLLAGPPGTGKSTIASAFANAAGFNLVELSDSIKGSLVGESEENLERALRLVENLSPVILFIDEIDQAFTTRSSSNRDGGVSSHYLKTILKFTARDDLKGKVCILGCSNTPQNLDPALIDRFTTLPLLEQTPAEMAAIFPKIEFRVTGKETLNPMDRNLIQGCELLHKKGASPRQIFSILEHTISKVGGDFSELDILGACINFKSIGDPISVAFSSLSSIRLTAFHDYLPWSGNPDYILPNYLDDIINLEDGSINEEILSKKLEVYGANSKF